MNLKQLIVTLLISVSIYSMAQEPVKMKVYGFVRSDFNYNSRQNAEAIDGLFHLFPKPVDMTAGKDKNAVSQAEMLSIATRIGLDISGSDMLGAKSSAKIEADFAGFTTNFFVLRIRHAYAKLNWTNSELVVGQTWHPLFGSVMPTGPSLNAGAPFQPFNRSPQVRFKYNLNSKLSLMAAGSYEMQYTSQGPNTILAANGANAAYLKNAKFPDMFLGSECKTSHWTTGLGVDVKTIKPTIESLTSGSIVAYTQFIDTKLQIKAKSLLGQNLTDYVMPCGYGVTDSINGNIGYTNFNMSSTWLNVVYGTKWQVGAFVGYSQNLGTTKNLLARGGKFTTYGFGVSDQLMLDRMYRIAPHVSYNLPNLKFGLEYDFTTATYGTVNTNGHVNYPSTVSNNRVVASASYFF